MSNKIQEKVEICEVAKLNEEIITCSCAGEACVIKEMPSPHNAIYFKIISGVILWYLLYSHLEIIAKFLTYDLFKLTAGSHFSASIEFLIFEVPKVLCFLSSSFFSSE